MAAALTLMAKERGGPTIRRQLLFYPVTDASFDTESYKQFATGYFLSREAMIWFWDQYTTDPKQRQEITASPLRATLEQLRGLPPALVINGEADVLRDEGEAYANKLRAAGVRVTAARFQGTIHDFVMLNALANSAQPEARSPSPRAGYARGSRSQVDSLKPFDSWQTERRVRQQHRVRPGTTAAGRGGAPPAASFFSNGRPLQ